MDSDTLKAGIEVSGDGSILLTKYIGENNKVEENSLSRDSLYLLNENLTLNENDLIKLLPNGKRQITRRALRPDPKRPIDGLSVNVICLAPSIEAL